MSAAGRVHMAVNGGRRRPGNDEVMAFGLARYACADSRYERTIGHGSSERLAPNDRILLAETHIERTRASDAHPIAAFAEIVRKRSDKPEAPPGFLDVVIARRTAGGVGRWGQGQRSFEARAQLRQGQELIRSVALHVPKRHHFDEG